MAIYMLHTSRKGVSSIQMAKELGITQKSAWFLNHRIREAMKHRGGLFSGEIEVDEVYIGGKEKNRHASKKSHSGRGAAASYNYLLVNGERRLTPRELLRLQGFPDSFKIACNDSQTRKQAGNAVPVPLVEAAIKGVVDVIERSKVARQSQSTNRAISVGATAGHSS